MGSWAIALDWIDAATREVTLFAAIGFLVGGIDDLMVDVVYLVRRITHGPTSITLADLAPPREPHRFAILVPAWDEAAVIGAMLNATLSRLDHPHFRILVGCYPNDRATIAAVVAVAARDPRVRVVIGRSDGPTTKADNLNRLWRALARDDAAVGRHTDAVVIHDAEDVVHPFELRAFDALLADHAAVQLPVLPLIERRARLVSGHYADEFALAHGEQMVVRAALGAGLPFAGVSCAIRVEALAAIAAAHGTPFDAASLTEDYELGLRLAQIGQPARFARVRERRGGPLIAVREYFPATVAAAVTQKARWMTGIALAGWDRMGWGHALDLGEHWMRMRDRRAPLAVIVLAAGYAAIVGWALSAAGHAIATDAMPAPGRALAIVLRVNLGLLVWRAAVRMVFTARGYGWRESLWSLPRMVVGNAIALLAARRAVVRYAAILAGRPPRWDKTAHVFPDRLADATE